MTEGTAPITTAPALGLSLQVQLSQKCTLVFQTHVDATENPNATLDKMANAADRLTARYELKEKRALLEQNEQGLKHMTEDLLRIDTRTRAEYDKSGKKGEQKLSNAQAADREKVQLGIERTKERVDIMRKELANLEAEAK